MPVERSGGGGGGTASPLTTKGDIYTFDTGNQRLPIGTNKQVLTANSTASTGNDWEFPPGFEINYTEITTLINVASSTEATGTTIFSPGAITFDGTPVILETFTSVVGSSVAGVVHLCLFEGATEITRLWAWSIPTASTSEVETFYSRYRFTPSAASHTYTLTAFANNTTGTQYQIGGVAIGTAGGPPAFARFTKV